MPRNAANARERTRMRVLSKAFGRLKLTLPWVPPDTKVIWLKGDAKPGKQPKIKSQEGTLSAKILNEVYHYQ